MMLPPQKTITKTWNEFWGPLLMVHFHQENPARWKVRERTANWIFKELNLHSGARVLDIGCGDGLLDICLGRLGAKLTAVDRISSVLQATAAEPDAELVDFICGDIREIEFASHAFDLVLMLDLIGLMSRKDEVQIIRRAADWLNEGGHLILDCPREPDKTETEMERELDGGILQIRSIYNPRTRNFHMRPKFHKPTGITIELCDCYAEPTEQRLGIVRYLYPKEDLAKLLNGEGFEIEESHYRHSKELFTFVARKRG
jgi:SAM-dependent methyltransferase